MAESGFYSSLKMLLSPEEYDKWYYTEKGRYISGLEKRVLLKMIAPVKGQDLETATCLDIGCGTGYFTQFLSTLSISSNPLLHKEGIEGRSKDEGYLPPPLLTEEGRDRVNVVGIDTSMDMIKYAIKNHKGTNIKYLVADAESLPFKDRSFDASLSITSVNFFKNPIKAVSEAIRISRNRIFLGVLNKWSILSILKKMKGFFSKTTYSDACFYNQREITNILSTIEFPLPSGERVRVRGIQKQHTYFFPFPRIHVILSGLEKIIPPWLPFGGFMGINGEINIQGTPL